MSDGEEYIEVSDDSRLHNATVQIIIGALQRDGISPEAVEKIAETWKREHETSLKLTERQANHPLRIFLEAQKAGDALDAYDEETEQVPLRYLIASLEEWADGAIRRQRSREVDDTPDARWQASHMRREVGNTPVINHQVRS